MKELRITTQDNPYNPFTQWDDWYMFDLQKGYHTCERLASVAYTSDALSDDENLEQVERAANMLLKTGAIDKEGKIVEYKKVYRG